MKRITVFTPAYNRAHLLVHCYESLLRQKDQRFCWLIIDDGSTDNSGLPCIVSDRIPKECKITDLLEFYSLDKTPNEWAKTIVKTFGEKEKTDVYRQVCTAGYDIKENAEWLQNFYVRAYEERKQRIE